MKRILLLCHGFMVHDRHDIRHFKEYIDNHCNGTISTELVYLYDRNDSKSSKYKNMEAKLLAIVKEYQNNGYEVLLLGYSFSCGLVAKVSSELNLKGVIYLAPTVRLLKTGLLSKHLKNAFKTLKIRLKHGNKKAKKIMERTKTNGIVPLSYHICRAMMHYKKEYKTQIPFLILRGFDDSFCLKEDVYYILKNNKARYVVSNTESGEHWDHFYVMFEITFDKLYQYVMNFLERIDDIHE